MRAVRTKTRSFARQVDEWVSHAVAGGAHDLGALLAVLPGVYPVDVLDSISRLAQQGVVSGQLKATIDESAIFVPRLQSATYGSSTALPVPHPLDFDWRFTEETANDVLDACRHLGQSMICLGAPTVFVATVMDGAFSAVALLDRNPVMVERLAPLSPGSVLQVDLLTDEIPHLQADVVVMDPPWYPEHFRSFLWAASHLCPVGGSVVISLPPRGTRPAIQEETVSILSWAKRLGFVVQRQEEDVLTYDTPPFETNALRAVGIGLTSNGWRKGTLCVLEKLRATDAPRPNVVSERVVRWSQASLFGTCFWLRQRTCTGFDDPALLRLIPGDILPSVSRRHRLRQYADVWSSGNRVFRCRAPSVLKMIVEALATGHDPCDGLAGRIGAALDRRSMYLVENAARTVHHVAALERDERRFIGNG